MKNMIIKCQKCKSDFIFSTGEQRFYNKKGLNLPKTCPSCKNKKTEYRYKKKHLVNKCPMCGSKELYCDYDLQNKQYAQCLHCYFCYDPETGKGV